MPPPWLRLQRSHEQQRRLARTALAEDIGVEASIRHIKGERHLAAPALSCAEVKVMIVDAA